MFSIDTTQSDEEQLRSFFSNDLDAFAKPSDGQLEPEVCRYLRQVGPDALSGPRRRAHGHTDPGTPVAQLHDTGDRQLWRTLPLRQRPGAELRFPAEGQLCL